MNEKKYRMDKMDRAISGLFTFLTLFAIFATAYIAIITTINIISRALFSHNMNMAFETSELAMAIISFGALPMVTLYNRHIKVDLVVSRFAKAGQTFMTILNNALCALFMIFLFYNTYEKGLRAMAQNTQKNVTGIKFWPFYMFIALMLLIAALCCLYNILHIALTGEPVLETTFDEARIRIKGIKAGKSKEEIEAEIKAALKKRKAEEAYETIEGADEPYD